MLGLVQHVYVMARGELVRVTLRVGMDLSVGPGWTKWALDRGSGGSWFPNPYWSSDCWDLEQSCILGSSRLQREMDSTEFGLQSTEQTQQVKES